MTELQRQLDADIPHAPLDVAVEFQPSLRLKVQRDQMLAAIGEGDVQRLRYWAFFARD